MTQVFGANYNWGSYAPTQKNVNPNMGFLQPAPASNSYGGTPFNSPSAKYSPILSGGTLDSFSSGFNGDSYSSLLDRMNPLQKQINQLMNDNQASGLGSYSNSPLDFMKNTINPLMKNVGQIYKDAMSSYSQSKASTSTASMDSSSPSSKSGSKYPPAPTSIPLEPDSSSSSEGSSSG